MGQDLERIRHLAKGFSEMEQETVVLYKNEDGTYGFCSAGTVEICTDNDGNHIFFLSNTQIKKEIVEYITPY